jgi:hypothetical protein
MKVTRVYTDNKGETHFEDMNIQFENFHGDIIKLSKSFNASDMIFSTFTGALAESWHPAPRKQAIIILNGEVDLEVSDGSKRRFGAGHVIILEDTTGKGHRTHSVDGKHREEVWVALD